MYSGVACRSAVVEPYELSGAPPFLHVPEVGHRATRIPDEELRTGREGLALVVVVAGRALGVGQHVATHPAQDVSNPSRFRFFGGLDGGVAPVDRALQDRGDVQARFG